MCDALKKWFSTEVKQIEVNQVEKFHFFMNNLPQECAICVLAIDSFVKNGWFEHVYSAEYLFLENIYSKSEQFKIGISDFECFVSKIKKTVSVSGRILREYRV